MPSAEYDLGYLRAGVPVLKDYLFSNELYWPIGTKSPPGEPPYPNLTLDGLLLSQKRAHARDLTPEQRTELAYLDGQTEAVRSRWRVAWERKAAHGFRSRLTLWRNFLDDYRADPGGHADRYAYEVGRRVMLHLLAEEAGELPEAEVGLLGELDRLLRARFVAGEFIWEEELSKGFPRETYWFLWGRLRR